MGIVLLLVFACSIKINVGSIAPKIELYLNTNNIPSYIPSPGTSIGKVKFLGKFNNTEDCVKACMSQTSERCLTFTFHTPAFAADWGGQCFGGMEDPRWSPMSQVNINSGRVLWPCRSNMDCSLNGKCVMDRCHCRPAWTGHRCDVMNLRPVERTSGYHYMEGGRNVSSWGGAVLRDNQGMYHMFAAEMTEHCGIYSWTLNSQLIHAVSSSPTGTYKRHDVIRRPFAHEPCAVKGPGGEFVIYWSEYKYSLPLCNCTDGSTTPGCKFPDPATFYTYMSYSMDPNGPWSDPVSVIKPEPRTTDTNFAPVILKDGSLIGFTRTNPRYMHLVTASNWKDPATYVEHPYAVFPHIPDPGIEDPFMYLDKDGHFHCIFHNMYPQRFVNLDNVGSHAYSLDGKNWVYGGRAYDNNVLFTDGGTFAFTSRERPHLVFAEDGVTPLALTNGARYGGKYEDATYTLLQPLAVN